MKGDHPVEEENFEEKNAAFIKRERLTAAVKDFVSGRIAPEIGGGSIRVQLISNGVCSEENAPSSKQINDLINRVRRGADSEYAITPMIRTLEKYNITQDNMHDLENGFTFIQDAEW